MATAKKKKEKEQFFEDLSRLDRFIDDEDETSQNASFERPRPPFSRRRVEADNSLDTPNSVSESHTNGQMSGARRKRKVSEMESLRMPTIPPAEPEPKPKPTRSFSSPVRESKKPKHQGLKRTKSHLDNPDPLWRKGDPILKPIAEDRLIFEGLVFYFVPDSESKLKDAIYRLRIRKAIQHGAIRAERWSSDVTHIIVCDNLNYSQVSKCFYGGGIPTNPVLVLVDWVVDSVRSKYPPEISSSRYQVEGSIEHESMVSQEGLIRNRPRMSTTLGTPTSSTYMPSGIQLPAQRDHHAQLKDSFPVNEGSRVKARHIDDGLQDAIRDVQQLGTIPLDPSFDGDTNPSTDDVGEDAELRYLQQGDKIKKQNSGFLCMEKHDGNNDNPNAQTIQVLQQMANYYDRVGDSFRARAYRLAIGALRKQSQLIRTKEEAFGIFQIGKSIAEKIEEIVTTSRLRKLEYTKLDANDQVLQLFMGIYQVGYPTASRWIGQGHRTLDDLRRNADLNTNQRIGLEHYDDFQLRIPRAEVAQHASVVEKALKAADNELQMIIGGSYRRGSQDSGDIDLIITKEGASLEHVRTLMMELVIPTLTAQDFLKVKLAGGEVHESTSKWHGASALPGASTWRRIDLLFVPWAELGAALIYFTGNDIFNRSLRLLASRKKMRLNQHGLYADVIRGPGRERVTDGRLLEGQDEMRIFEILGVPYRPPEHRQC